MGRVDGKVAVVTGAASNPGLGRTTAMRLAAEGAQLLVTDVDEAGAHLTAADIVDAGGTATALHQDVVEESRWIEVIEAAESTYGRLDILVNNAGIEVLAPISELSLEDWNRQIAVNLTSVFLGCKYAMPAMRRAGGGSIINISSVAGLIGLPGCVAYGATKGGVRLMTKTIAMEGSKDGIRCNSVHPGVILTNMQARAAGVSNVEDYELPKHRVPLGRAGTPQDIADAVLYLASDEANYVTGAELVVDAGMTAQ